MGVTDSFLNKLVCILTPACCPERIVQTATVLVEHTNPFFLPILTLSQA